MRVQSNLFEEPTPAKPLASDMNLVQDKDAESPKQTVLTGDVVDRAESRISWLNWRFFAGAAILAAAFLWSYWPALLDLLHAWNHEPDYSHGYLVPLVAVYFLWSRRAACPDTGKKLALGGLLILAVAFGVRHVGAVWYLDTLQDWSILIWLAGACCFLGGWRLLRWSLPAISFLVFMIPLPYRAERLLSLPLQKTATRLSCWLLQALGEPAIREGNIIVIDDFELSVVEACSGLRIFVSIAALAFAYLLLAPKPWWTRLALVSSILPVALITNALRIVVTGWFHAHVSDEAANRFAHDLAGWCMLPFAAACMASLIWYMGRLIVEVHTVSPRDALGSAPAGIAR